MRPLHYLCGIILPGCCHRHKSGRENHYREAGGVYLFHLLIEYLFQLLNVGLFVGGDEDAVVVHFGHPRFFQILKTIVFAFHWGEVVRILLHIAESVNLVEKIDGGFAVLSISLSVFPPPEFVPQSRVGDVDDMYEEVGLAHLVECGFERLNQVVWQLAYESHGVRKEEWEILDGDLRTVVSSVANSLFSAKTSDLLIRFMMVDLPTLVYPTRATRTSLPRFCAVPISVCQCRPAVPSAAKFCRG